MADEQKKPQGLLDTLQQYNPIAKAADIAAGGTLQKASPSVPATTMPPSPAATRLPSGDIELPSERNVQVQWADPTTGKRMWGTKAERDRALAKKPVAKVGGAVGAPRSPSKR